MGRFTLRLPDTLHMELEQDAQREGVSLNQYLVYRLAKESRPTYTIQVRSAEELAASREKFEQLIERLRGGRELDIDQILDEREVEEVDEKTADLVRRMRAKMAQMVALRDAVN